MIKRGNRDVIGFEIEGNYGPIEARYMPPIYSLKLDFLGNRYWFPIVPAEIFASLRRAVERTAPDSLPLIPSPDDVEPKSIDDFPGGEKAAAKRLCLLLDAIATGDSAPFIEAATEDYQRKLEDISKQHHERLIEIQEVFERLNRAPS